MGEGVGVHLDQDVGSGSLWKGSDRLGSSIAWILGWLNEGLNGEQRFLGVGETRYPRDGLGAQGRGPLSPVPGDPGKPGNRAGFPRTS